MAKRHTVHVLNFESESGNRSYTTAARRPSPGEPRKMSYGAAINVTAKEALTLKKLLGKIGAPTRISKSFHRKIKR